MRSVLPAALDEDPEVAVPALTSFVAGMSPATGPDVQFGIGESLRVPPRVRAALFARDIGGDDVLAAVDVPVLVAHGTDDAVVDPTAADHAVGKIPGARLRWFPQAGHAPFAERAAEFSDMLGDFARECFTDPA